MKIFAVSDMHGYLPDPATMPEGDLLLIGGDICPVWNHDVTFQQRWLVTEFNRWLSNVPYENIVGIGGNHDFVAMRNPGFMREKLGMIYLQDETLEIEGLKIHGTPWVTGLTGWAFCASEDIVSDKMKEVDHDIDILLSHAPPFGVLDGMGWQRKIHVGSTAIASRLSFDKWPNLKAVVCGHIHEGFGRERLGEVDYYNVAYLNERYDSDEPNGVTELATFVAAPSA